MLTQEAPLTKEKRLPTKGHQTALSIGIPKENQVIETRIALTPMTVKHLIEQGFTVIVEKGAGKKTNYSDLDYSEAGAKIEANTAAVFSSNIILKIKPCTLQEIDMMKNGAIVISTLQWMQQAKDYFQAINKKKITALAFEYLEDDTGGLPIVTAMSEIAGSTAIMLAAQYLGSGHNQKGILLGGVTGIPRAHIVIIGAGTVAEYAARTAIGLGCSVDILDNHLYRLRRINKLLDNRASTSILNNSTLETSFSKSDVVIAARRSEKKNPLITDNQMAVIARNSVIIDLNIDSGGCFATSELTTLDKLVYRKKGLIHCCTPNITCLASKTASMAISNVLAPILSKINEVGGIDDMISNCKWLQKSIYAYKGNITNHHIASKWKIKFTDISFLSTSYM